MEERSSFRGLAGKDPEKLFSKIHTPSFVLDEGALKRNGEIISGVIERTGCKILLAQKAFSNFDLYDSIKCYMSGTEASGLFEARLGKEECPEGEVHAFCAAYRPDEFDELLKYADHIVFNSPSQLKLYGRRAKEAGKSIGLRINPECSTQEGHEIYDPCAPGSRLGTTRKEWDRLMTDELVELLDGLHFHTLCEQNSDDLKKTLMAVEEKFSDYLPGMKWLNMGGGHHITRDDYDIGLLEECIEYAKNKWDLTVYLEPGEAWALNAGYLVSRVLDVFDNGAVSIAIIDASPACHTPDVLEMPYTPPLYGTEKEGNTGLRIRLGGPSCLSGDVMGDYCFDRRLEAGDILTFGDMAIYSTCKTNTFNGMPLPSIYVMRADGHIELIKEFGYMDFKERLGRVN